MVELATSADVIVYDILHDADEAKGVLQGKLCANT